MWSSLNADFLGHLSVLVAGSIIGDFIDLVDGLLGDFFDLLTPYVDVVRLPLMEWLKVQDTLWAKTLGIFLQSKLWSSLGNTVAMVGISGFVATLIGIPLGIVQVVTEKKGLVPVMPLNKVLGTTINIGRSIPFIILVFLLFNFSSWLMGGKIGVKGALVPLSVCAIPFMARITEVAIKEVPRGLVEAAQSMGASPFQIIHKVLLPEAMPGVIAGITIMLITLIGYSAMAGVVGAGGLGDYAINHGYQRKRYEVIIAAVILIVLLVQITQYIGDRLAQRMNHR